MRDPGRTRVRAARRPRRLACGCHAVAGAVIVSYSRGPWLCAQHTAAPVRAAGQPPRRGARTVADVLRDEAARGP